jgi:hypothetical protein
MNPRDEMLLELSALLDGELDREQRVAILDRLATRGECRQIYLEMRKMEEVVRSAELPGTLPGRLWRAVQRRAGHHGPGQGAAAWSWLRPVPIPAWALGAAAVLLLTLVVWGNVSTLPEPGARRLQPGVTIQVGLGSDEAGMDDERFVELTTELLRGDRRYHRKMLEVMQEVDGSAFIAEGAGDVGDGDEGRAGERSEPDPAPRISS